jgi:hypothetical protein
MHMLQSLFYLTIAVHVLGIIITYLQEHKTTVTTASGNCYTVIDRVKLFYRTYCIFRRIYTIQGESNGKNLPMMQCARAIPVA